VQDDCPGEDVYLPEAHSAQFESPFAPNEPWPHFWLTAVGVHTAAPEVGAEKPVCSIIIIFYYLFV